MFRAKISALALVAEEVKLTTAPQIRLLLDDFRGDIPEPCISASTVPNLPESKGLGTLSPLRRCAVAPLRRSVGGRMLSLTNTKGMLMGGIRLKCKIAMIVVLGWLAGAGAAAAPAEPDNTLFQGADIFRVECATDPQIRPDGRAVAYARQRYDIAIDRARLSIWLVDVDTGAQTPLVTGTASYSSPRWSPDGTRLAYVAVDERGHAQLMVRWMQSGTAARVADLVDTPKELTWSPDGGSIAFVLFT